MSRLTRDGTAEPVSRDQILRHARGQGNVHFPYSADHEQDWQPYPVDPYSAICDDHTYIHTYTGYHTNPTCCNVAILPVVTKGSIFLFLPGSRPWFSTVSRCMFSTLTPRHPMDKIYLIRVITLSPTKARLKDLVLSRIELTTSHYYL